MIMRVMRILLFYDLPMTTAQEQKIYRIFHKNIEKEGFVQMQESVYTKIVLNLQMAKASIERLKKIVPSNALVQVLTITEKQYASMECIAGKYRTNHVDVLDRLIII